MDTVKPLLQAEGISKRFGTRQVLRELSLALEPGRSLAIMGKSGCGKTTLLNLLGGLDRPDAGCLRFRGEVLRPGMLRRYRKAHVGFLFQGSGLIGEFTALENVQAAVDISGSGADPMEYLALVGMADRAKAWPRQLSGGQGHRVALARALAKRPAVLLLDEPTEGLDRQTGDALLSLTCDLCREAGVAMVVVTHRPEHAARMDRSLVLEQGQLVPGILP